MKYAVLRLKPTYSPQGRNPKPPTLSDYEHVHWLNTLPRYPIIDQLPIEVLARLTIFRSKLP